MLDAAQQALITIFTLERLGYLWFGVLVGLLIGVIPGIGGLTGFAILVPFTYAMDPVAAFALLLGMSAVTSTSDTIPAVLFGVPGTASSQATVLDGLPMTKRGEAGRALSAAYFASLLGGLFGAFILALSIPIVRPFVLSIGTPELLAMTIFGLTMVSSLSGTAPMRGIVAACFGILIGMIGTDVQTGTLRWTGDVLYLWDGIPMLPILLGIFALPELCDMAIQRKSLASSIAFKAIDGMLQGVKDCLRSWFLIIKSSSLGALLGATPGITGAVTDWIAYGFAMRTEKDAEKTFSKGDVRGVIAVESAVNATDGGSLLPTLAFGVPGSASQAILLGALMVHGFIPGPDMLTKHLDFTYTMVWSIAIANIAGAGICFMFSGYLAKISTLRPTLILPVMMAVVLVGAFQGSRHWGDMYVLLLAGVIGWTMKRLKWPRPPLILGLVLGVLIERYMAISILRFGADWLLRPGVVLLLTMSVLMLMRPLFVEVRHSGFAGLLPRGRPSFRPEDLLYVFFIGAGAYMLVTAQSWAFSARVGPTFIASVMIAAGMLSFIYIVFSGRGKGVEQEVPRHRGIYMDLASPDIDGSAFLRAGIFLGWFVSFLILMSLIGLIPTVPIIIIAYMRLEGREPWRLCFIYSLSATLAIYLLFDRTLHIPWPRSLLGDLFPVLRATIPSM